MKLLSLVVLYLEDNAHTKASKNNSVALAMAKDTSELGDVVVTSEATLCTRL